MFRMQLNDRPVLHSQGVRHGKNRTYTTKKYKEYKEMIAWKAKEFCKEVYEASHEKPFSLQIYFELKNKVHGDLDNMCKAVVDSLEGIAFNNDKFMNRLFAAYEYGDEWALTVVFVPEEEIE